MSKKTQILFIHGGMTFKSQKDYLHFLRTRQISLEKWISWSDDYLQRSLGKNFEIIKPRMPKGDDAKYKEWEIFFSRYLSLLNKRVILIGNSLGGIFLAKYLSEHKLAQKTLATFLVCPPFDNTLSEEDLVGGFELKKNLSLLQKNSRNLYLLFSADDDVVPAAHAEKYRQKLPAAQIMVYPGKNGHFRVAKFPEIIKLIKQAAK
jgi:predicted alpha/beta hydrolase family esterase